MRAIILGLVCAIFAAGEVRAEPALGCKLDGLELAEETPEGFGSQRFRVLKVESRFWRLSGPEVNDFKPDGYVKALIESQGRRYVITQTYSRYGMPANSGISADATPERVRQINAKVRSAKGERARVNGVFLLLGGPLGDEIALTPVNCR